MQAERSAQPSNSSAELDCQGQGGQDESHRERTADLAERLQSAEEYVQTLKVSLSSSPSSRPSSFPHPLAFTFRFHKICMG